MIMNGVIFEAKLYKYWAKRISLEKEGTKWIYLVHENTTRNCVSQSWQKHSSKQECVIADKH